MSLPFGDGYTAQVSGTYGDQDNSHFAQLDRDAETDTDHGQFRQYYNTWGRWMSPDPYSGSYDITNPQSFNRYSYVNNNPISAVDPSGMNQRAPGSGGCNSDQMDCGGDLPGGWDDVILLSDTVCTSSMGCYSYGAQTWDDEMANGYGGGMWDDNGYVMSSNFSYPLGFVYTNMFGQFTAGVSFSMPSGTITSGGGGFVGVAPNNNNPFKEWPLNGNITPDTYQQDQKCSAGPVIGPAMDSLPGVKAACQWHDNKYIEYNCNATSWISPFPGPCKAINYMLLIKIYNAL